MGKKGKSVNPVAAAAKKQHHSQFSATEESLLLRLAIDRKDVIENQTTDSQTTTAKNEAWVLIATEFNARGLNVVCFLCFVYCVLCHSFLFNLFIVS